jgi:hypothetical protein
MATCAIPPKDKRLLARHVGKRLVSLYGKRQSYSPKIVKAAMRRCEFPDVWDCWALSLFSSASDFDSYHSAVGEACDYAAMHADMLSAVQVDAAFDFSSLDWLDGTSLFDSASIDLPDSA